MDCRELQPHEVIEPGDYFQNKIGGHVMFSVHYAASMTVTEALAKWPHITAFYRRVTNPETENT